MKWKKRGLLFGLSGALLIGSLFPAFAQVRELPKKMTSDYYYNWTVNFTHPMDAQTVNADNLYIMDANNQKLEFITPMLSPENPHQIILKNNGRFSFETIYSIVIQDALKSTGGANLKQPVSMKFELQDTLFQDYSVTVRRINDLSFFDQNPSGYLYIGRTTCPDCVFFNQVLQKVQSNRTIYYLDAQYWKNDPAYKKIVQRYDVDWVPTLVKLKDGEIQKRFDTKNEANITVQNLKRFLEQSEEMPIVHVENVNNLDLFNEKDTMFFYIGRPSCHYCATFNHLLEKVHSDQTIYYVNIDRFPSDLKIKDILKKYNVESIPFFAKLDQGVLKVFTKERNVENIEAFLKN